MAEQAEKTQAPGLRWRGNSPMWRATKAAIASGYPVKSVNLSLYRNDKAKLVQRCERLQAEMLAWMSGRKGRVAEFDGTIKSLIQQYLHDPESGYRKLKASSRHGYDIYAAMIQATIGARRIEDCDGRDVNRWFAAWSEPSAKGQPRQIAKARFAIAVLKSALSFGIICRSPGCAAFKAILSEMSFPALKPRTAAPTAAHVIAARKEAHRRGHAAAALAYALQFDGVARQWDVIGQWIPIDDPLPSAVIAGRSKWIGPTWASIDGNLIFRYRPSKTEDTTGVDVVIDLRVCPMVMEELQHWPVEARQGPLIVNPNSGLPYSRTIYAALWRDIRAAAGIPPTFWNRDLRAGGITEARRGKADLDDLAKMAGHSERSTTADVYDRSHLEAARRVAAVRLKQRRKEQPK